jgi:hypothetical protein
MLSKIVLTVILLFVFTYEFDTYVMGPVLGLRFCF